MNILDEIKKDIAGAQVLYDWLGDTGNPVGQELANDRAITCVFGNRGRKCPKNKEPLWWEKNIKLPVAQAIKRHIALKKMIRMETSLDSLCFMCSACGCELTTKIWVPIEHIKKHTAKASFEKMPEYCWQVKEMTNA